MTETLYYTNQNDPDYTQLLITAHFHQRTLTTTPINPKYPSTNLVTPEGIISQPNAIMLYLAKCQPAPIEFYEWLEFSNIELRPLLQEIYGQIHNTRTPNQEKYQYSVVELLRVLETLNNHLKIRTFFVGDSLGCVDISLACHLDLAFKYALIKNRSVISEETRKKVPHLLRWLRFVRNTPPFVEVLGPL